MNFFKNSFRYYKRRVERKNSLQIFNVITQQPLGHSRSWGFFIPTTKSETLISTIVQRMGEEALELSPEDLELAGDEVKTAIEYHLDARDFIEIALDA